MGDESIASGAAVMIAFASRAFDVAVVALILTALT
jgi:hypothetical protein